MKKIIMTIAAGAAMAASVLFPINGSALAEVRERPVVLGDRVLVTGPVEFEALEPWQQQLDTDEQVRGSVQEERQKESPVEPGRRVVLSGLVEFETHAANAQLVNAGRRSASDAVLATAMLGVFAEVDKGITGNIQFLWEEDDTEPVAVDVGTITIDRGRYYVTGGMFYPPFGNLGTHFMSDPLVLNLAEMQQTGVRAGMLSQSGLLDASVTVFNGQREEGVADKQLINDFVLAVSGTWKRGSREITAGASHLSDLADTDADLTMASREAAGAGYNGLRTRVPGLGAFVNYNTTRYGLSGEFICATRRFDAADYADLNGLPMKPAAWNFEAAFPLGTKTELAFRYEGSNDFNENPQSQYGLDATWRLGERTSFSLEYLYGEFELTNTITDTKTGAPVQTRQQLNSQLAIEF